jgi:hypothetical protein
MGTKYSGSQDGEISPQMMKLTGARATLPVLLMALGLLVAACDQGGDPGRTAQAVSTQAVNAQTNGDPATAAPATGVPTDVMSAEATATILVGQGGIDLTSVDPCKLLTQEDVKSAMGDVPYRPKPLGQDAYHTACSYVEPTLEVDSPRLFVSLDPTDLWDLHPSEAEAVSGIGDAAYSVDYSGWRTLSVLLRNKVVVSMDIYPPDLESAKQLISKAIERLP